MGGEREMKWSLCEYIVSLRVSVTELNSVCEERVQLEVIIVTGHVQGLLVRI